MSSDKSREVSILLEKRASQWEDLMRKFSEAHRDECKTTSRDIPRMHRSLKKFPTGSQYDGTWDVLGMSGYGTYTFPNDVKYVGEFEDGMFHGQGDLRYPSGVILRGKWKKGHMYERKLIFADGLEYSKYDWKYCRVPDRRFKIEYSNDLQPAGKSYLTAEQPTRTIPPGYYDTGDGFYDPKTKIVYNADDLSAIIRSPSLREQKWIENNCRTAPETSLGPCPGLYEEWSVPLAKLEVPSGSGSWTPNTHKLYYENVPKTEDENETQPFMKVPSSFSGMWNHKSFIKFRVQNLDDDSDD